MTLLREKPVAAAQVPTPIHLNVTPLSQYVRPLRHGSLCRVYLADGTFVNAQAEPALVRQGWVIAKQYPPDTKYAQLLANKQAKAIEAGAGFWAIPTAPPRLIIPTDPPQGNCSPCYPSVCIPPPPPDLDCGDIPYKNFAVVGCDPHRFDGDNDGIGCER